MDDSTRLHHRPDAANPKLKRSCLDPILNPVHGLLESLLELSGSSSAAIDLALSRVVESKIYDEDKDDLIERAIRLGSALAEAGKRSEKRRAASHNAAVWPLPSDLTIKVFALLDTKSVCHAAAACSYFQKCSTDPLCYSNIDLTSAAPKANSAVASIMIQRAGKNLRSLRLGVLACSCPSASLDARPLVCYRCNTLETSSSEKRSRHGSERFMLSRSCLSPLVADGGASGALLKRLYLYNIERLDNAALGAALSACPGLLDLEIVGLHVELRQMLESVCKCPLIERLFFESSNIGRDNCLKLPTCTDLAKSCPCLSSLALRGFELHDTRVRALFKGLRKLKHVDFSASYSLTGEFLTNLGGGGAGSSLEFLILRDCVHLREAEVSQLLSAMLAGRFARLRRIDVSNRDGLACEVDLYRRCYSLSFPSLAELLDERPGLSLIAEFPAGGFPEEEETMDDSDVHTDTTTTNSPSSGYVYSSSAASSGDDEEEY